MSSTFMLVMTPILILPRSPPPATRTTDLARSIASSAAFASGSNASPAVESTTRRVDRSNSDVHSSASSALIAEDAEDCTA
jgi:hypothetical protein